jgi:2-(1,2-epoxy-1,2-dihydrophenyl)acetyl-CoA isomerase
MDAERLLFEMDKPTIAMINRACIGAALSLAAACDFRFSNRSAIFRAAFNEVGLSGDYGGSWLWTQNLGTAKAREFYLLSERYDATRALTFGLTQRLFEDGDLRARTLEIAHKFSGRKAVRHD